HRSRHADAAPRRFLSRANSQRKDAAYQWWNRHRQDHASADTGRFHSRPGAPRRYRGYLRTSDPEAKHCGRRMPDRYLQGQHLVRQASKVRSPLATGPDHHGRSAWHRGPHTARFLQYRPRGIARDDPRQLGSQSPHPLCQPGNARPRANHLLRHRGGDRGSRRSCRSCRTPTEPPCRPRSAGASRIRPRCQTLPNRADIRGETCHTIELEMEPPPRLISSPVASLRMKRLPCSSGGNLLTRRFSELVPWSMRLRLVTSAGSRTKTLPARTSMWLPIRFALAAVNAQKSASPRCGICTLISTPTERTASLRSAPRMRFPRRMLSSRHRSASIRSFGELTASLLNSTKAP